MLTTLAFRHLMVRKIRSLFLLLGFALGVGVMVVLLSIGEAMLDQSRDVSLVGGGEVTVLPQGIDVEAMRTGGLSGMFFTIDRARYLTRQAVGGPRHDRLVRSVAPAIEGKLLYLCPARGECAPTPVRAGGEIPSRAAALGAGLDVREGRWHDSPADSAYVSPRRQQLYDELDRFHLPRRPDSTWGEWHYFNFVTGPDEWWYVNFLLGGEVSLESRVEGPGSRSSRLSTLDSRRSGTGRWGGRLLMTHRRPDGRYDQYTADLPPDRISFDTARADLALGESFVRQRDGVYHLRARARGPSGAASLDLEVHPMPGRYFPPVELSEEVFLSGYVVPALAATAEGRVCAGGQCRPVERVPAYHDHNWGVWRDVTWEWGAAQGRRISLLYAGVYGPNATTSPFFLALVDSLGVRQVLRFGRIEYAGKRAALGARGASTPESFTLTGTRDADTVRLTVEVSHTFATEMGAGSFRRHFLQMRGRFELRGRMGGEAIADEGHGFFETHRRAS